MRTNREVVLEIWCRLTGRDPGELSPAELAEFFDSPQLPKLAATPYPQLLEAAIRAASRGSLPLQGWLTCVDYRAVEGLRTANGSVTVSSRVANW